MWRLVQRQRGVVCGLAALLLCLLSAPAALAAPANDAFADAQSLGSATLAEADGTTTGATVEPGEEGYYGSATDAHSVWYRWTAPRDARVWVDNCHAASDSYVEVYTGTAPASLNYVQTYNAPPCSGELGYYGSRHEFQANAGTTYRIRVFSDLYYDGAFHLTVHAPFFDGKLSQTASRKRVPRGRTVTYKVRATNTGSSPIDPDVVLMMAKPGTLHPMKGMGRYVSVSSTGGRCRRVDLHFGAQPGAICNIGWLRPGESIVVTARVRPRRSISHTAFLSWRDSELGIEGDDRPGNDSPKRILRTVQVRG